MSEVGGIRSRIESLLSEHDAMALTGRASTLLGGQLVGAALTLAATIVLARALGGEEFGQLALIVAVVLIASQILDARSWEVATRFASEHLAAGDRAAARASIEMAHLVNFAGGLGASAIVIVLAIPISSGLLGDRELTGAVIAYSAVAPFVALQNAAAIAFRVLGDFRRLAVLTAVSPVLRLVLAVGALLAGAGLTGVVIALLVAEAFAGLAWVSLAQRLMHGALPSHASLPRIAAMLRELRRGWRVILASNFHGTLRVANEQLDVVLVGIVATPAAAGALRIARTFAQPLVMLQKPFYEAIYPRLTEARARGLLATEWALIRRLTPLAAATLLPLAIAISAVAPWLIPALAGASFSDAWEALVPIALATAIVGTAFWVHPAALATGLQGRSVASLALGTALQAAAVVTLVPVLGIAGAGLAYAFAMAVWLALLGPAVRRRMADPEATALSPVLVVGPTPPPYHGSAMMTERLLDSLRERGALAGHLDTRDPRPLGTMGHLDARNVWLGLKHSVQFALLLLRHPGACVYVPVSQGRWGFLRDAVLLLVARLAGRRRIVHLHGGYFRTFHRESGPAMRLLIRLALGGVEQAWVLSDGLRDMFDGLVPAERVRVLANSVDDLASPDAAADEPVANREEGPRPVRVLYLSNLHPEKGWDELVATAERLAGRGGSPLDIRFVGEVSAADRAQLLSRTDSLSSSGIRVEVLGTRVGEEKLAEYRRADLFVYPSRYRYDGQPLVLLEAMSAGLPIITSSIGAIPETVSDGENAIVIAPGDTDQLVSSIERAARDAGLRRRLGTAARRRYLARYTPSRFNATVESLIFANGAAPRSEEHPTRVDRAREAA